jgi:hypothetical protein
MSTGLRDEYATAADSLGLQDHERMDVSGRGASRNILGND